MYSNRSVFRSKSHVTPAGPQRMPNRCLVAGRNCPFGRTGLQARTGWGRLGSVSAAALRAEGTRSHPISSSVIERRVSARCCHVALPSCRPVSQRRRRKVADAGTKMAALGYRNWRFRIAEIEAIPTIENTIVRVCASRNDADLARELKFYPLVRQYLARHFEK